ncbi:MAG: pyruvate kinase [Anaerolineae bacterium]|nr:pyruvate kinase [Anaerolineae bacterium]
MNHTKIVCTIGPASREQEMLEKLIEAGMNVARLNFSHGDQEYHAENIRRIRAAAEKTGRPVAITADLQGPKLRVGKVAEPGVAINEGERIVLTTAPVAGHRTESEETKAVIPIQYEAMPKDVNPGERILIDDGLMELSVESTREIDIVCTVVTGGIVHNNKGLNLPGTALSLPGITQKDWEDLDFLIAQQVDWVALSFVRTASDVEELKKYIDGCCSEDHTIRVIAKIEKPQALDVINDILEAADAIMVARGDLGIEIPAEKLPMVQKRLIRLANRRGRPVITATQMLDSMIRNPRPTRAEASDVANAILDGTDAIMLSGETAIGHYPLESVRTMTRIAKEVEEATLVGDWQPPSYISHLARDVTDAVSHATCETADDLQAKAIIASTASGWTARSIAKYRPHMPIIAVTPDPVVRRQLALSWGVLPLLVNRASSTDEILKVSIDEARKQGLINPGDRVVVTASVTPNIPGATNMMTVERVPDEA